MFDTFSWKTRQNWVSYGVLLVLSCTFGDGYAGTPVTGELAVIIESDTGAEHASEGLPIRFTLQNRSERTLKVLKWDTPFDPDFGGEGFEVWHDARQIEYQGRLAKRLDPEPDDYLIISAGDSVSTHTDIALTYAVQEAGDYAIAFNRPVHYESLDATMQSKAEQQDSGAVGLLRSETITVQVDLDSASLTSVATKTAPAFASCANLHQGILDKALSDAEWMARETRDILNLTPVEARTDARRYETWFGQYTASRYQTVTQNFTRIHDALANKRIEFDCGCYGVSDRDSIYAFVYPNQPYRIYLCGAFWRAQPEGEDSKGGTIIHEMSHFAVVADTNDYAYGQNNAKALAIDSPSLAVRNAENHEYMAENTPRLPMGSTELPDSIRDLVLGQTVSGALSAGRWQYYHVRGAADILLSGLSADAGLYVKADGKPSLFNYDCKPYQAGTADEICHISGHESVYVGVYAPVDVAHFSLKAGGEAVREPLIPERGLWWNPDKGGSGWAIERSGSQLSVIWYTYDTSGQPVWYLATGPYADHHWSASLQRYHWNGEQASPMTVGSVQLTFSDARHAELSWGLGTFTGTESIRWLAFATQTGDEDRSGIWYAPEQPGSGVTFVQQGSVTSAVLYFYDGNGQPRWALNHLPAEQLAESGGYRYQLASYMGGACPHCRYVSAKPVSVGELQLHLNDARQGYMSADVVLQAPLSGHWRVDNAAIENMAR